MIYNENGIIVNESISLNYKKKEEECKKLIIELQKLCKNNKSINFDYAKKYDYLSKSCKILDKICKITTPILLINVVVLPITGIISLIIKKALPILISLGTMILCSGLLYKYGHDNDEKEKIEEQYMTQLDNYVDLLEKIKSGNNEYNDEIVNQLEKIKDIRDQMNNEKKRIDELNNEIDKISNKYSLNDKLNHKFSVESLNNPDVSQAIGVVTKIIKNDYYTSEIECVVIGSIIGGVIYTDNEIEINSLKTTINSIYSYKRDEYIQDYADLPDKFKIKLNIGKIADIKVGSILYQEAE